MTDKEFKLMEYLMKCNKNQKKKFVDEYLIEKYTRGRCIITKDYTVAFGDIPIGLVVHMDTVFEETKKNKKGIKLYYDTKAQVMFCPESPGFDDTAGVFAVLEILRRGLRPTVILCQDEERGCLGATQLVKTLPQCPVELRYLIELDRAGFNDCVFYECDNEDFISYIESCGFEYNIGSFSDISAIGPAWGIASVNLSIGFENEHSYGEILHVDWMYKTIEKVATYMFHDDTSAFKHVPRQDALMSWDPAYGISKEDWVKYVY